MSRQYRAGIFTSRPRFAGVDCRRRKPRVGARSAAAAVCPPVCVSARGQRLLAEWLQRPIVAADLGAVSRFSVPTGRSGAVVPQPIEQSRRGEKSPDTAIYNCHNWPGNEDIASVHSHGAANWRGRGGPIGQSCAHCRPAAPAAAAAAAAARGAPGRR